jgi:hypothetical protein
MLIYLKDDPRGKIAIPPCDITWFTIGRAVLFTNHAYLQFVTKAQKG